MGLYRDYIGMIQGLHDNNGKDNKDDCYGEFHILSTQGSHKPTGAERIGIGETMPSTLDFVRRVPGL